MESYGSDELNMGFSLKKSGLKTFPMLIIIESPNGLMPESFLVLFNLVVHAHYCQMQCAFLFSFISLFFLPLPSPRRREREAFPVSNMWLGYKKEELLEAAYGDTHRFKKPSVSALSIPLCSQGQSQIPHEGKAFVDGDGGPLPVVEQVQR